MSSRTVHIAIKAHVTEDEISGQIGSDGGPPASFHGWLGLISALDRLLSHDTPADRAGALGERRRTPGTTDERRS